MRKRLLPGGLAAVLLSACGTPPRAPVPGGRSTAHTDGVALHATATPRFPGGVLFAVHDDKVVSAFDLRDVVRTLGLSQDCVR